MSDEAPRTRLDLLTRLRNQRDWHDAISKAEQSGGLAEIIRLIYLGVPVDQSTRLRLEALSNDHRVVRRKRGPKKKQLSMKDIYADAAHCVRVLEEAKRRWKEWDGAKIDARVKANGVWIEGSAEFNERVRRGAERLLGISDPVIDVAEQRGLDWEKLENVVRGKTGFGRKAKPKSNPDVPPTKRP